MKLTKKEAGQIIGNLAGFLEFVSWQEREGNIDGSADPAMIVERAKQIMRKLSDKIREE